MAAKRQRKRKPKARAGACAALCTTLAATGAHAEPLTTGSYTLYGTPGLIDMPSAEMAPDAELATTIAVLGDTVRSTLSFQVAPRLSGSLRYSFLPDFDPEIGDRYDRSFDLRFQLLEEQGLRPALAIGLQDFAGTGVYSGEYIVATKSFGRAGGLRLSAGIGWGRFGTANVIAGDEGTRVTEFRETGGTVNFDQFFTGPVGAFGGLAWDVTDRLSVKAEYSSDAYVQEEAAGLIEVDSPWNVGLDYALGEGTRLGASWLHGTTLGVQLTFTLNPTAPPFGPGVETAPLPVVGRPPRAAAPLGWSAAWIEAPAAREAASGTLAERLAAEGILLEEVSLSGTRAEARVRNTRWGATAQALGRTVRVMSAVLPPAVEVFAVTFLQDGVPAARHEIARSEVERLENAAGAATVARVRSTGGTGPLPPDALRLQAYPDLAWRLSPYLEWSFFDPDQPVRANAGLRLAGDLRLARGLVASGSITQPIVGNLDEITREPNEGALPIVRSDFASYVDDLDPSLDRLTLAHFGRPSDVLFSRVTAGYLERMYAGVSGELLWKPVDSRLALGVELNHVQKRDPDDIFGLEDYDVTMGHVSAYYDIGNGYFGQVDVGRYLAGDDGATFTLERVFDNGWRVGAYATFTDVPFEEFGEGSFDKGVLLTVPLQWLSGRPTRASVSTAIRSLTADGGARLNVADRLYDRARAADRPGLEDRAGRFWK